MAVDPLLDFSFEVWFGDAIQMTGILDFDHGPIASDLSQRLYIHIVDRISVINQNLLIAGLAVSLRSIAGVCHSERPNFSAN